MDFRKDIPLQQQKQQNFEIQSPWVPATPAKPIAPKRTLISSNGQGNLISGPNWRGPVEVSAGFHSNDFAQEIACQNGISGSRAFADRLRDLNSCEAAALASATNPVQDHNVRSQTSSAFSNPRSACSNPSNQGWRQIPFKNLLAFTDGALESNGTSFAPFLIAQIGGNQKLAVSSNQLLLNGKVLLSRSPCNGDNRQPQIPQYGFPVRFLPTNFNSLPDRITHTVVREGPLAPVTPDKGKRVQDSPHPEVIDLDDERVTQGGNLREQEISMLQHRTEEPMQLCSDQGTSKPMVISFDGVYSQKENGKHAVMPTEGDSLQQLENEKNGMVESQGIDLNKTPQQATPKPRRRKHRPKVIREGKAAKTPKPVTPRPAKTNENPTGKRKYVRRKKAVDSLHTSSGVGEEPSEPDSRNAIKSARRSLNFDAEEGQARDGCPGSTLTFKCNVESEGQGACKQDNTTSSHTKSTLQLVQGLEVVVENSPAGIAFDLNRSVSQILEDYIRLPESQTPPPQPSRREMIKGNLKDIARKRDNLNITSNPDIPLPSKLQTGHQSSQHIPNSTSNISLLEKGAVDKGVKRNHTLIGKNVYANGILAHLNFMQADRVTNEVSEYTKTSTNQSSYFPEIFKKKRTEKGQNEVASNASPSVACPRSKSWENNHVMQNNCRQGFTFADAQRFMDLEKLRAEEHILAFDKMERMTKKRSKTPTRARKSTSLSTTLDCNQLLATPEKPHACDGRPESMSSSGPQACLEALVADTRIKMKTKARTKKGQVHLVNSMFPNTNQMCLQEHEVASFTSVRQKSVGSTVSAAGHFQEKKLHLLRISSNQDCHSSNFQQTLHPNTLSQEIVPFVDPVDDIIQKLKILNINGRHEDVTAAQAQNALVPYIGGDSMMVPYEGPFVPIKKRRPRPKVDLDPESHRVWKLLMGKEATDGVEGTEVDREKWWEGERQVFRGRAESFIARMHLVQGDRRFSQWKGSVVDSVVGVFLTQNVSDHLSSSAYMALAARFPLPSRGANGVPSAENMSTSSEQRDGCNLAFDNRVKWQERVLNQDVGDRGSTVIHEVSNESLGSNIRGGLLDYSKNKGSITHGRELEVGQVSPENWTDTPLTVTGSTSLAEAEDRRSSDDVVSSQNSVVSFQTSSDYPIQAANQAGLSSELNSEMEDPMIGSKCSGLDGSTSFTELLQMAGSNLFQELYSHSNGRISLTECCEDASDPLDYTEPGKTASTLDEVENVKGASPSMSTSNSLHHHAQHNLMGGPYVPSTAYRFHNPSSSEMENVNLIGKQSRFLPSAVSGITMTNGIKTMDRNCSLQAEYTTETTGQQKLLFTSETSTSVDSYASRSKHTIDPLVCSRTEACVGQLSCSREGTEASSGINTSLECSQLQYEHTAKFQHTEREADFYAKNSQHAVEVQAQIHNCKTHQTHPNPHSYLKETSDGVECSSILDKEQGLESKTAESNSKVEAFSSQKAPVETASRALKHKKGKVETEKKSFDWDSLRKQACCNGPKKERSSDTMDSMDWEAIRRADVSEISNTIRERGMNNMLAERIKDFLDRLVREHGSLDLEWLRDVPPDKAKDYLLSIRGLGLKSVECVRLLTLHHLAFPVDTNVGRICVRLGWVPLQPLPESLQLHLLEMYPMLETIQKYLWPRLCMLDQRTLYELHYQMITFGKVFCTKSKPNCNACPMRGECKHFASAFASARLALPGPEEKSLVSSTIPIAPDKSHKPVINPIPLPQLEGSEHSQGGTVLNSCEPIIEEPQTPEPEYIGTSESAIEDAFYEDPDEIPTIKLNVEEFTQNLQNYMQANNMELQDGDLSKALVALNPEVASIPVPKLKNVSRLRTEHQVYELPDSHPLLEGLDQREPDDPSSYLLAIWTPGETAQSTEPPEICCNSQDTGKLCDKKACFACNSVREAHAQTVRGTILIPCRTAMRGTFPLNGTYFQVNEIITLATTQLTYQGIGYGIYRGGPFISGPPYQQFLKV